MNIPFTQDELKFLLSILAQIQLVYKDSKRVNLLIERLDSFIEISQPTEVTKQTTDPLEPKEGEVAS